MSVINRMLQDLDRRQALETADASVVRASAAKPASREWFWRVLVVLLTAALAWMGLEWAAHGKPSALGIVSGAVAGLVAGAGTAFGFAGAAATGFTGSAGGAGTLSTTGVCSSVASRKVSAEG